MTRIAIMGVAGRMGRTLVEAVGAVEGLTLAVGCSSIRISGA